MNKKLILIITITAVASSFTTFALTSEYPCDWHFWRDYDTMDPEWNEYDTDCGTFDLRFAKNHGENIFSEEILLDYPNNEYDDKGFSDWKFLSFD